LSYFTEAIGKLSLTVALIMLRRFLVLDGALPGKYSTEVNYAELLRIAVSVSEFQNIKTMDEDALLLDWPNVRYALNQAFKNWGERATIQPVVRVEAVIPA